MDPYATARARMVEQQIAARGVHDERVLAALRKVPRHAFVLPGDEPEAYDDNPLSIGHDQTISQPYIVAYMTEKLDIQPAERVLEVGTGSGYQTAVLAVLAGEVDTIEIVPELGRSARRAIESLGHHNVRFRIGDGWTGWPERAPYDAILVTAAPPQVPQPLVDQLAPGGRLVLPVGTGFQELLLLRRTLTAIRREHLIPVRFVPMTGEAQGRR
jgi:protein-L-isoaspartate(D-aspartate) O-methyltransferase